MSGTLKNDDINFKKFGEVKLEEYQEYIKGQLEVLFPNSDVKKEWNAMREERALNIYSPRVDVAVGPFATHGRYGMDYDEMFNVDSTCEFVQHLITYNRDNLNRYGDFVEADTYESVIYQNSNARCFMAIEIENKVSRKHLMGGAINASALGRLGVVIPWTDDKLKAFVRLVRYLHFLKKVDKNTFNTTNLLIVTKEQFHTALSDVTNV
ncbi:hypothetical protein [Halalkalibacter sp. APA_J-10(15)]|uniref:hypothetical protein n=1 Tax=Halalkalibacter sp. APA_J-10(15) TaxID=2933805 RepID=UPI001FF6F242|nr:hypothetical protein [Halalkalibacter sp. APA_J-10(15)]MCK0473851.1 hypothetical protein [Halalkalibacter sp. APA_J-10(15)]